MNSRFTAPDFARAPVPPVDGDVVDLRRLLTIARRQFRLAAACTLAGAALGLVYLATATPLYTSTATLLINPLAGAPVTGAMAPVVAVSLFDSETGILLSEKIAADAFAAIDPAWLAEPPTLAGRLKRMLRPRLAAPEAERQRLLDRMRAGLVADRPDAGFLLELSYTSPAPDRAAAILGAFIAAYRDDRTAKRREAAGDELRGIRTHADDLRARLDALASPTTGGPPAPAEAAARQGKAAALVATLGELVRREEEVRALAEAPDAGVRVVSPPQVPVFDSSPNGARALLLSTLAGALAGVGLGLLREASERGFRSMAQVRRELGVPCLALLPVRSPGNGEERADALRAIKLALDDRLQPGRLGGVGLRIGFAPVAARDGASTTARSYAELLAAAGTPTLLIDADMRGRASDPGFLAGFSDTLDGGDVAPTLDGGLAWLPAGTRREAAAAAISLGAPDVADTLARIAAPFEVTVIDLPPLLGHVDARVMARHLDAIVVVARWRRTERRHLRALLSADPALRRKVAGVVLNRASPASADRWDDDLLPEDPA